ncbi:tudor domain-containing protein 7B isoform X2 [Drosophila busckii]|nr:tudor domain-containing protein 7B isoform X2 [Drosophila busckii]XP_017837743.1 tudor domain-containing protein 7B isoform X2 [Drosophila busckii]
MVQKQKPSKSKGKFTRPQAAPVRHNVRPPVTYNHYTRAPASSYTNNNNYSYAQHQRHTEETIWRQELLRLRQELCVEFRKLRCEQEVQQRNGNSAREFQYLIKAQDEKVNRRFHQLQVQHQLEQHKTDQVIQKLQKELELKVKAQEQQRKEQGEIKNLQEVRTALQNQILALKQRKQQLSNQEEQLVQEQKKAIEQREQEQRKEKEQREQEQRKAEQRALEQIKETEKLFQIKAEQFAQEKRKEKEKREQEQRKAEQLALEQRKEKEKLLQEQRKSEQREQEQELEIDFKGIVRELSKQQQQQKILTDRNNNSRNMNGNTATATAAASSDATTRKQNLRPILGNSAPQRPNDKISAEAAAAAAPYKRPLHTRIQHQPTRSAGSVNYRLKQQQQQQQCPTTPTTPPTPTLPITPPESPENSQNVAKKQQSPKKDKSVQQPLLQQSVQLPKQASGFEFNPAYDAISLLQQYCVAHSFAPPNYEYYNAHKSKRVHCKVHIGSRIYTSYPEDHADEASARQRTSELAIERLKSMEARKPQVMAVQGEQFLLRLYQELVKHPHGIVSHKLPQWYEATVKLQVPGNWESLISSSDKMRLESSNNMVIVFANTDGVQQLQPQAKPLQQQLSYDKNARMPELQLPWSDGQQDWSMYITHCDSTMHVWARLIDQSSQFEQLTEELNEYMSQPQQRKAVQQAPVETQIYVVEVSDNWNRVRIMSLDAEQRQCSCHFVDFGDEVNFSFDNIYMCPTKFLKLPPQAVCLSMYALDKFEEHPHALPVLAKELAGHSVVTRIITSAALFQQAGGCSQGVLLSPGQAGTQSLHRRACIIGTFYDTSTSEDIHLNDLVANQINRNTPAPMLKLDQKSNHVIVSHVNDMGDLMVQLPNEDLKFVQRSIARIMSDSSEQQRVQFTDLLHDQLVCICDESSDGVKHWYRGMLAAKPKSADEEVFDVYYVDDGRMRKTHISNIYRLEANNLALASYPAQALRVRLHDVPPIDTQMLERLRSLLKPQTPVLLKVMEGANDKLPMVTIHVRGQDSLYLCLNSAIRMEHEVQSSTRLVPFDDGGLHFSSSGQLIRRSSFSSTVSSHSSASDQPSLASPPVTPRKPNAALLPQLKEYEAIPAIGAYFEVRVALSVNPGHFAVQPYKWYNQFQNLMKQLQAHCKSSAAKSVESGQLAIGQAFAAPDSDGVYHRVNIRKIYDEMIQIRYVDVGDDGVVRCDQLLQLPNEFRELPMISLPAQLYGIQLADVDWTQENCIRFRKLTLGQKFIGAVRRIDMLKDGRRALSLELIDTSTPQDIKVHEILISEKQAQPAAS